MRIKSQQDFVAGLIFLLFGLAGLWFGSNLSVGTISRMGPGYFPLILSIGLVVFAAILLTRGVTISGANVDMPGWRHTIFLLSSLVAFALLIGSAGVVISVLVLIALSSAANRECRWTETAILAVGLTVFTVLLFVYGLGLPLKVWPA